MYYDKKHPGNKDGKKWGQLFVLFTERINLLKAILMILGSFLNTNIETYNTTSINQLKYKTGLELIVQFLNGTFYFRSLWFLIIRTLLVSNKKQLLSGQVIKHFFIKGQINSENWWIFSGQTNMQNFYFTRQW